LPLAIGQDGGAGTGESDTTKDLSALASITGVAAVTDTLLTVEIMSASSSVRAGDVTHFTGKTRPFVAANAVRAASTVNISDITIILALIVGAVCLDLTVITTEASSTLALVESISRAHRVRRALAAGVFSTLFTSEAVGAVALGGISVACTLFATEKLSIAARRHSNGLRLRSDSAGLESEVGLSAGNDRNGDGQRVGTSRSSDGAEEHRIRRSRIQSHSHGHITSLTGIVETPVDIVGVVDDDSAVHSDALELRSKLTGFLDNGSLATSILNDNI